MMKILVLGGTGAIGAHLVPQLVQDGHAVTVTSRVNRTGVDGVNYVKGNARKNGFLSALLSSKWDVIIDFMVYRTKEFARRYEALLRECSRYVFLSTVRVYGDSSVPITEDSVLLIDQSKDSSFLATDEYALAKTRQERMLRTQARRNWVIVRPSITYSETRLQLGTLEIPQWCDLKSRRSAFVPESLLDKQVTLTYAGDTAAVLAKIVADGASESETYNIATHEATQWSDVIESYQRAFEQRQLDRLQVELVTPERFLVHYPSHRHQLHYHRMFDQAFDSTRITKFLSRDDFTTASVGLQYCLATFIERHRKA